MPCGDTEFTSESIERLERERLARREAMRKMLYADMHYQISHAHEDEHFETRFRNSFEIDHSEHF